METALIPENVTGKQNDLSHTVTLDNSETAHVCYVRAQKRMLNPAIWHELCGTFSASFALTDAQGEEVHRLAKATDHLRIDLPGPGSRAGSGYDWVQVEQMEREGNEVSVQEQCGMRLRSCPDPRTKAGETAHFFTALATSTFMIHRNGNVVTTSYHGRNEVPNTDTANTVDNMRNAVITSGALAGLSEMHWLSLIKSFLEEEVGG